MNPIWPNPGRGMFPTMQWFGKSWGAPINDDCPQAAVPVGAICGPCDEPIAADDTGIIYSNGPVAHWECFMRQTVGSIAHQKKICICYGGLGQEWPGELTKREAAIAAVDYAGLRRPGA